MDAVSLTEAIFYELRPGDVNTTYVTEFNQLVFDILMNACDEEAGNIGSAEEAILDQQRRQSAHQV